MFTAPDIAEGKESKCRYCGEPFTLRRFTQEDSAWDKTSGPSDDDIAFEQLQSSGPSQKSPAPAPFVAAATKQAPRQSTAINAPQGPAFAPPDKPLLLPLFLTIAGVASSWACFTTGDELQRVRSEGGNSLFAIQVNAVGDLLTCLALFVGPVLFGLAHLVRNSKR
jgi:hypothetical protein